MGFVYIFRSGTENLFKIGRTVDVKRRGRQLATGNPHPLTEFACIETEYASECEKYLHQRLRTKRSRRSEAKEFFEIDPSELEQLLRDADRHVGDHVPVVRDADRLAKLESDGTMMEPEAPEREKYLRLLEVREAEDGLAIERERLEAELKLAIGSAAGLDGIATWKSHVKRELDIEALKMDHPALYKEYERELRVRSFRLL